MKLDFVSGSYDISFFNIHIDTPKDIDNDFFDDTDNWSTFIHEFIHYLQDLVLPYTIKRNLTMVRGFFDIISFAETYEYIKRPFNNWSQDYKNLMTQFCITMGVTKFIDQVLSIKNISNFYIKMQGYDGHLNTVRQFNVYGYKMLIETSKANSEEYILGARDFLEYIAYKIESKFNPNRPKAPQLPYESIDIIFDEYGFTSVSEEKRICVAEFCLFNDAPMHMLINTLFNDKDFVKLLINGDYQEVYEYLMTCEIVTRDGNSELLTEKTLRRLNQFAEELRYQYNGFNLIVEWITKVNAFIKENFYGKFLFSDIYNMNLQESKTIILKIINEIGVPIVSNSKKQFVSLGFNQSEKAQFAQIYTLQHFLEFVCSDLKECPVYDFCKANAGKNSSNCMLKCDSILGNADCYYNKFLSNYGISDLKYY